MGTPELLEGADPVRVLVLIGSLDVGGAERHLALILPKLDRSLVTVEVYCISHRGVFAADLEREGIRVHAPLGGGPDGARSVPARAITLMGRVVRLMWHLARHRPRVLHCFLPESHLIGTLCATLMRVPVRVMSRRSLGLYQLRRPMLGRIERRLHASLDVATGNSRAVLQDLEREGIDPRQLRLIYNGVEDTAPAAADVRDRVRRTLGTSDAALVLICVANLIPYKGHADLLDALGRAELDGEWELWCVGRDNGPGAELREQARRAGIGGHVQWLGTRRDVPDLLTASDVAISSSHEEGFSNAVLEAMSAGLPVIATDAGGNAEAVEDRVTGIVVPVRDVGAMARALEHLADNPRIRAEMGEAGRHRAHSEFSVERCVDAYERLYRDLTS